MEAEIYIIYIHTYILGVCDIIVIVVLTMCNLTISSILQNPN